MARMGSSSVIGNELIKPSADQSREQQGSSPSQGGSASLVLERSAPILHPSPGMRPQAVAPRRTLHSRFFDRLMSEDGVVTLIAFTIYLIVAILLDFKYQILPLDAVSRMANGYYVLWSGIPIWQRSVSYGAHCSRSPIFPCCCSSRCSRSWRLMTSPEVSFACWLARAPCTRFTPRCENGVEAGTETVLTLVFGINPIVLYYAGNGMSDMLYMFLLVLTTRYFLRWLHHGGLRPLVYAGSALGLAYLDRYEALGAASLAAVVVLGVSYRGAMTNYATTSGVRRPTPRFF